MNNNAFVEVTSNTPAGATPPLYILADIDSASAYVKKHLKLMMEHGLRAVAPADEWRGYLYVRPYHHDFIPPVKIGNKVYSMTPELSDVGFGWDCDTCLIVYDGEVAFIKVTYINECGDTFAFEMRFDLEWQLANVSYKH